MYNLFAGVYNLFAALYKFFAAVYNADSGKCVYHSVPGGLSHSNATIP